MALISLACLGNGANAASTAQSDTAPVSAPLVSAPLVKPTPLSIAAKLVDTKQYASAEALLKQIMETKAVAPDPSFQAQFLLANCLEQTGRFQDALQQAMQLSALVGNAVGSPPALKLKAQMLLQQITTDITSDQALAAKTATEKDPVRKAIDRGDLDTLRHDDNQTALDYEAAYDGAEADLGSTISDHEVAEHKYGSVLIALHKENQSKALREFTLRLLLDPMGSLESLKYGLLLAGTTLHYPIGQPSKDLRAFALSVADMVASPVAPWDVSKQGGFILSLVMDKQGRLWAGTEDTGVWCDDTLNGNGWVHYDTSDGLGDNNAYALACDSAGRIWVGHLNHGVSVFNGTAWKNYSGIDGPGGSRVFAIATCPTDGDVWVATEAGLARYSQKQDWWFHYTTAQGLPCNEAIALDFDSTGRLFVGTAYEGVAIATPKDNYATWRRVIGPYSMPNTPDGVGIPSNFINALLVTHDDTIWVGTNCGLAHSKDHGDTWSYVRGNDWRDKVAGLYKGPKPVDRPVNGHMLAEDYVTCLTQNDLGDLFIGYRQQGFEVLDLKTGAKLYPFGGIPEPTLYMSALLPLAKGYVMMGRYGEGLKQEIPFATESGASSSKRSKTIPEDSSEQTATIPVLPTPMPPPNAKELADLVSLVRSVPPTKPESTPVVALNDDWQTQGNWLGRYGRYFITLNAQCAPLDYPWGAGWDTVSYYSQIGPHHDPGDSLRYWVHWLYTTNPRTLEMPPTYLHSRVLAKLTTWDVNRRQSEQDDHGEWYPSSFEGPDIYYTLTIPRGLFYLSLYDFNKDGHDGNNRYRDYKISIRPHDPKKPLSDIASFSDEPELAHERLRDFWGGVYKRFLVQGPLQLTIKMGKNNSFNTVWAGVMLDLIDEDPPPYFLSVNDWQTAQGKQDEERSQLVEEWRSNHPVASEEQGDVGELANNLFAVLEQKRLINPIWWAQEGPRFYAPLVRYYKAVVASNPPADKVKSATSKLGSCYYYLGQYSAWEDCQRTLGLTPARDIEHSLRWDGLSREGEDYNVVMSYLAEHPEINEQGIPDFAQVAQR